MTRLYRSLLSVDKPITVAEPPEAVTIESDFIIIIAALLCAVICVVGLISVARCAWQRRGSVSGGGQSTDPRVANKGVKKKVIETLPKVRYNGNKGCEMMCSSECAICLGEYVDGDEIRVLPQCGHRFHVGCIDKWLSSHSSCPSCRQILVTTRCEKCGELPMVFARDVRLEMGDKGRPCCSSSSSTDHTP